MTPKRSPHTPDNPITIDPRTGSDRLADAIHRHHPHTPVTISRLAYADAAWLGLGPDHRPVPIGVEYKTVGDALNCMCDGRFAGHQLPGLVASYEVIVLLLEGCTRPASDGILQLQHATKHYWYAPKVGIRRFMYRDLDHWLATLTFKAGVRVIRTSCLEESAAAVSNLYTWWTAKDYADHRSHLALQDSLSERVNIVRPRLLRRIAAELPGVGWTRSAAVDRRFGSVMEMALADESDWAKLEGIGKTTAQKVCAAIRGETVR